MMPDSDPHHEALDWLHHLYGTIEQGWLTLFSFNRATGSRHVDWATVNDLEQLAGTAITRAATSDVWFGVATRTERLTTGRGGAEHCDLIPGLWLDVDIAGPGHLGGHPLPPDEPAALELINDFPIPPSAIIRSGGGLQPWWLLNEPRPAAELRQILAAWGATWDRHAAARGWHLDNVYDVARIMRLPGTWNRKTDTPIPVETLHLSIDRRFGLDDLEQHLDEPPAPPAPVASSRLPYIGPERPGDAFNATHTGDEILTRLGFHPDHVDHDGNRHYRAPHRPGRGETTGATVYTDDGHVTIWSATFAANHPSLELRRPYDPFGLAVATLYNGDWSTATTQLRQQGYGTPIQPPDLTWITGQPEHTDPEPAPTLDIRWVDDLDRHAMPPEPPVLVDGLLRRGEMCVFGAPRAIGKTWLAYNLAIRLAEGHGRFLGNLQVRQQANVLYLQGELDQWGSAVRWKMLTGAAAPLPHVAETFDRLRFRTVKRRIAITGTSGHTGTEEYVDAHIDDRLETAIVDHDIDVVIVDPWAVYLAAAENSNDDVEAVLGALREITLRTGVAWVIIHHITGKAERSSWTEPEDLWRGATRLADWASTRVTVLPHYTEAQYKELGLSRREARRHADVHFLRRSTPTDDFTMRLDEGWWVAWTPDDDPPGTSDAMRLVRVLQDNAGQLGSINIAAGLLDVSHAKAQRIVSEAIQAGLVTTAGGGKAGVTIHIADDIPSAWAPRGQLRDNFAIASRREDREDDREDETIAESVPDLGERAEGDTHLRDDFATTPRSAKPQVKCGEPPLRDPPPPTEGGPPEADHPLQADTRPDTSWLI